MTLVYPIMSTARYTLTSSKPSPPLGIALDLGIALAFV